MSPLNRILLSEWQKIRQLTYDYLAELQPSQLAATLPFAESQTLGYQFWCMTGAQESYIRKLAAGKWTGFASSLDLFSEVTPALIRQQMERADQQLAAFLAEHELEERLANGQPAYEVMMQIIKHEMHHHGQLINFLYANNWPIPQTWHKEWALSRD